MGGPRGILTRMAEGIDLGGEPSTAVRRRGRRGAGVHFDLYPSGVAGLKFRVDGRKRLTRRNLITRTYFGA